MIARAASLVVIVGGGIPLKILKRMAALRQNATSFDKVILEDAARQHLRDLKQPLAGASLQELRHPNSKLQAAIYDSICGAFWEVYTSKLARIHARAVCGVRRGI